METRVHQALGGHTTSHRKSKPKQGEGGHQTLKKTQILAKIKTQTVRHQKLWRKILLNGLGKSSSTNTLEETDQSLIVKRNGSKVIGSSSVNTVEDISEIPIVNEDNGKKVLSESSSDNLKEENKQNSPQSASDCVFNLNEIQECEDYCM